MWGGGSFALSACLPLPWARDNLHHTQCHFLCTEGEGIICIVSSSTKIGGITVYQIRGRGSFTSSTVLFSLLSVEMGEGLICVIHSVSPSTCGGGAHLCHL